MAEDDPAWLEACRREDAIRTLLQRYPGRLKRQAVEGVAEELGLSRATLLKLKLTRFGGAVQAFNRRLHDAQDTPALFA